MSFPSADDLRRNTKRISKAEQDRAEVLRRAQEQAESEARIEQGVYTTRSERRKALARKREKEAAAYTRALSYRLPGVRDDLNEAMRSAAARGETRVRVKVGDAKDDYEVGAGGIIVNELRERGYSARVVTHQELVDPYADGESIFYGQEKKVIDIEVSWQLHPPFLPLMLPALPTRICPVHTYADGNTKNNAASGRFSSNMRGQRRLGSSA